MINKVFCLSIDLINADKPPAALAFMAGACEAANKEYAAVSVNNFLFSSLTTEEYDEVYSALKLSKLEQFESTLTPIITQLIQRIMDFSPDVMLVSMFSFMQQPLAEFILKSLRQAGFHGNILAGGPGIDYVNPDGTSLGKIMSQQGLITHYCLGEGDAVILDFLNETGDFSYINTDHDTTEKWVPQIAELDAQYLMPSYKRIDLQNYHNYEEKPLPVFSVSTSRGCVRKCTFCDVANRWPKFRFRSGKSVAQEVLKHHLEVGAVHFHIVDSLINGSLKSFKEFNEEIIKMKQQHPSLEKFSYNGMFIVRNAQSHPDEFFKSMKEAGCESLAIGVETGSDRLRAEMAKNFTLKDLDHHLAMCQKYKIRNFLLMFVGYPTETQNDFDQTLDMLHRYQKYLIDGTVIGINHSGVFGMLTDTPVWMHRDELGIEVTTNAKNNRISWFNKKNPELTVKERMFRDLMFRKTALDLRYPIQFAKRYLGYLRDLDEFSDLVPD